MQRKKLNKLKKKKLLQAKEKFIELKAEHEKEIHKKNNDLNNANQRVSQKENTFNQKLSEVNKKDARLNKLISEVDMQKSILEKLKL